MPISGAVGNPAGMGAQPINRPPDVLEVKKLLYAIKPAEGGPAPADWPICDPANGGIYDPRLQQLILDFQLARRAKGAALQGEQTAGGRVMPYSKTWAELVRVASICSQSLQATSPGPSGYLGATSPVSAPPKTDWNPPPPPTPSLTIDSGMSIDDFLKFLVGKRTNWSVTSGAGVSFGVWFFGFATGTMSVTRPDGTSFTLYTTSASVGISALPLPASAGASGPDTPGAALTGVFANGSRPLTDDDFTGPFVSLSIGTTLVTGFAGAGATILFFGFGNAAPGLSQLAGLLSGPIGGIFAALRMARGICVYGGVQYGTPDASINLSLGGIQTPAQIEESTQRLDRFGPKI